MKLVKTISPDISKFSFDTEKYPFQEIIAKMFDCDVSDLERIHEIVGKEYEVFEYLKEQDNVYVKTFYKNVNPDWEDESKRSELGNEFLELSWKFIQDEIATYYDEKIVYQKIPSIRFQLPKNLALGQPHRDKDLGEHRENEISVYLPLTIATGNRTVKAETEIGKGDYVDLDANFGEFYIWNGVNLMHKNELNDSEFTRISLDFRFVPLKDYDDSLDHVKKFRGKVQMKIGDYFEVTS